MKPWVHQYFKKLFIYLFVFILAVLALHCCVAFSLVAEDEGCLLVVVCRLLTAVASPVVEHRLEGVQALVVAAPRL